MAADRIAVEFIAGPLDGEHHHVTWPTAWISNGAHYWTYQWTGRTTPDGYQLWALVAATTERPSLPLCAYVVSKWQNQGAEA